VKLLALLLLLPFSAFGQITSTGTIIDDDSACADFLCWEAVSGADSYEVCWDTASGQTAQFFGPTFPRYCDNVGNVTSVESASDLDSILDDTYYFTVRSVDPAGFKGEDYSDEIGPIVVSGVKTRCDSTLSAGANVGTAISGATAGNTICLNAGSYAGFTLNGVSKNPRVTVRAVSKSGVTFTSDINVCNNTRGLLLDGIANFSIIQIGNCGTSANIQDITIRNFNATGNSKHIFVDGITITTTNILIENGIFNDNDLNNPLGELAGSIHFPYGGPNTARATIRNVVFDGGCSDGINTGSPIIVEDSRFLNKVVGSCPDDPHTDALQLVGVTGTDPASSIFRRNYFYSNVQVLTAFDEVEDAIIENNLLDPGPSGERRPSQIEWYSDNGSIIRYNTAVFRTSTYGHIELNAKDTDDDGFGTQVYDNIANSISIGGGSTASVNSDNCLRSGSSPNVVETPTYTNDPFPSTFAEAILSAGGCVGEASDGGNPGIRFLNLAAPANFSHN
jgi:hypothetical protein